MTTSSIGLHSNGIILLSEKIRDAWNYYFLEFRVCQHHIRYTDEERTNYIGDLVIYFDDTVELLSSINMQDNYRSVLYDAVAILQLMYVQQDLIDELRRLFRLPQSSSDKKATIRRIRNELTGHPISRGRNGELISSVFVTAQTKDSTLQYVRYHKDKKYKHHLVTYDWKALFQEHEMYLEENLNDIVEKIKKILKSFKQTIELLLTNHSKVEFNKLIKWVNQVYEQFHKNTRIYSVENISFCYSNKNRHNRYSHVVNVYLSDLKETIIERIQEIDKFSENHDIDIPSYSNITSEINIVIKKESASSNNFVDRSIHYEFGKLYDQDDVFGVEYFLLRFKDDFEVYSELQNMCDNNNNEPEYYSSYVYLMKLFRERNLLR